MLFAIYRYILGILFAQFRKSSYLCTRKSNNMEDANMSIEDLIANVLDDISTKGYSSVQPFVVGEVEERMIEFAKVNDIALGGNDLYMSAKQLQHSMRASKGSKGLNVSREDLIQFPNKRYGMDLYYDGECFIYTDGVSKFIVHPNYKMKISRPVFVILFRFIRPAERGYIVGESVDPYVHDMLWIIRHRDAPVECAS